MLFNFNRAIILLFILVLLFTAFHKKCIDPWLTKNKRTCPLCKKKAIDRPHGADQSDSDDSADDVLVTGQSSERTPLLSGTGVISAQSARSMYGKQALYIIHRFNSTKC